MLNAPPDTPPPYFPSHPVKAALSQVKHAQNLVAFISLCRRVFFFVFFELAVCFDKKNKKTTQRCSESLKGADAAFFSLCFLRDGVTLHDGCLTHFFFLPSLQSEALKFSCYLSILPPPQTPILCNHNPAARKQARGCEVHISGRAHVSKQSPNGICELKMSCRALAWQILPQLARAYE